MTDIPDWLIQIFLVLVPLLLIVCAYELEKITKLLIVIHNILAQQSLREEQDR